MARAKAKAKAPAKRGTTNVPATKSDWETQLAAYAAEEEARVPDPTSAFISLRGGMFTFGEQTLDSPLEVIVVNFAYEQNYYDDDFDPDNPSSPACYALALRKGELAPDPDKYEIEEVQSESCAACPLNQWGTSDRGRGKACAERRRLQVVPFGTDHDEQALLEGTTQPALIRVPTMSMRFWDGYVKTLAKRFKRDPRSVVTALHLEPDQRSQFLLKPVLGEVIDAARGDVHAAVAALREQHEPTLMQGYETRSAEPRDAPAPRNTKRTGKLTGGKRKAPAKKRAAAKRR